MNTVRIDELYDETAKLDNLTDMVNQAVEMAGDGKNVTLTGPGPVWLYLAVAHALHGKALTLSYDSPATGQVMIFDHNPH